MSRRNVLAAALVSPIIFGSSVLPAVAVTATFNFDAVTIGLTTTFFDLNNGIQADFTSPPDSDAFYVAMDTTIAAGGFQNLSGNVLSNATMLNGLLKIAFSQPITSIRFSFALGDPGNTFMMNFATDAGVTEDATGSIPAGHLFPEGLLSYSGPAFTSVTLSSVPSFAIDNIVVSTSPVPVPAALPLFASGLGCLGLLGWRRRRKTRAIAAR